MNEWCLEKQGTLRRRNRSAKTEGGKERGVNGDERRICINTPCAFVGAISVNSF